MKLFANKRKRTGKKSNKRTIRHRSTKKIRNNTCKYCIKGG